LFYQGTLVFCITDEQATDIGTRKAEVLNSLKMNITAKALH